MTVITLASRDLMRALDTIAPALDDRLPILGAARLTREGDHLCISGTDMDMQIDATAPAELNGADVAALLARPMAIRRAVRCAGSKTVALVPGEKLGIAAGDLRLSLYATPASDWPAMEAAPKVLFEATLTPAALAALRRVSPAISDDLARYYLNGVHIHRGAEPETYTAVATDGHRLYSAGFSAPEVAGSLPDNVIIPSAAVRALLSIAGREPVRLRLSPRSNASEGSPPLAIFECRGARLTAKLIDGKFPDYRAAIPQETPDTARVSRANLRRAVATLLAAGNGCYPGIKLTLANGKLTLEHPSLRMEGGPNEIILPYRGSLSGPYTIGLNGRYLAGLLDFFGSSPRVTLAMKCAGEMHKAPILVTSPNDGAAQAVVMPLRDAEWRPA